MATGHDSDSRLHERQSDPVIAAAAAGNQTAWDTLVDRHAQRVWAIARGLGLDGSAAAAVCHLTWMRLIDHLHELRSDDQLRDWLCSVTGREGRAIALLLLMDRGGAKPRVAGTRRGSRTV